MTRDPVSSLAYCGTIFPWQSLAALCLALAIPHAYAHAADPIKLNGPLVFGGNVSTSGLQFSPDSSRVLYHADQETNGVNEIYSVPSTGGTPVKLNDPLVANGDVDGDWLAFSPDSSRVLYRADQTADEVFEIYSVPSTGGTPVKLNGPLVSGGDAFDMQFSPDSSRVLYGADQDTNNVFEIYSVPSAGGTPVKLNGPLVAGGGATFPQFSPGSSRVLYKADQDTVGVNEIYSVPSAGGTVVKLNGPLVAGGHVDGNGLAFSPDSSRVLYRANQETNDVFEIYSVPSTGGTPVKLNGPLVAGGDVTIQQFSPDSSRVLYHADQETNGVNEIYSVPSTGGTAVKLNGPLVAGGGVFFSDMAFSPDSSRVLYRAVQDTNGVSEIYSVPSTGGTAVKLNGPLVAGGDVFGPAQFSPDSSRVLYLADQTTNDVNEIYSVPSTGGTVVKLNGPLVAGGDVFDMQFSPDSSRVLYRADQDTDGVGEIYLVPSKGGTPVKLNGPLVAGGGVSNSALRFSPDGSLVLYRANQDTVSVTEAFIRIVRQHALGGGGDWDSGVTWDHGGEPDDVMQVLIDTPATVTASGAAARTVNELAIGGGTGTSTLNLVGGAVITSLHGVSLLPGAVVRGDGRIQGVIKELGGELRVAQGDTLTLSSASLHDGRIFLQGGTLEIDSSMKNSPIGQILGRGALITGGLLNLGQIAFSSGVTDVFGDLENDTDDRALGVSVSGNADVTFWDDVKNVAGSLFRVSAGSSATFFGTFSGAGISGTGDVFFEADVTPGASPALAEFGGNVTLDATADLIIELGGLAVGSEFDALDVAGQLSLGGTLAIELIDGFMPAGGDVFKILTAGKLVGTFTGESLPPLPGLLAWNVNYDTANDLVSLAVVSALSGDFDFDGDVDGRDFLVWQRGGSPNPLSAGDLALWQAQYGTPLTAASTAVPEPASLVLLGIALCLWTGRRFASRCFST